MHQHPASHNRRPRRRSRRCLASPWRWHRHRDHVCTQFRWNRLERVARVCAHDHHLDRHRTFLNVHSRLRPYSRAGRFPRCANQCRFGVRQPPAGGPDKRHPAALPIRPERGAGHRLRIRQSNRDTARDAGEQNDRCGKNDIFKGAPIRDHGGHSIQDLPQYRLAPAVLM
jgi:hypothetical protein